MSVDDAIRALCVWAKMDEFLKNVTIFDHPLIKHKVSHLRDVHTGSKEFCEIVNELSMLMGYEALADLPTIGKICVQNIEESILRNRQMLSQR